MKLATLVVTGAIVSTVFAAPVLCQMRPGAMSSSQIGHAATGRMSAAAPMSEADMAKMKACNRMSAGALAADPKCVEMMHAHRDMMRNRGVVKSGG